MKSLRFKHPTVTRSHKAVRKAINNQTRKGISWTHQISYWCVLNYEPQITMWPHESLWFCNDLALSDLTITMATAHTYVRAACDGEWWRQLCGKREREEGDSCGERWGRIWSPAKFPKEQFTVMDEYTVTSQILTLWMCVCVCWRRWNAEWFQRALKLPWIQFSVPTQRYNSRGAFLWSLWG